MKVEQAINHDYSLSATVLRIWQSNDEEGKKIMLLHITAHYKEKWFKGLLYDITILPKHILLEKAEDAFLETWIDFNKRGKAGKIQFEEASYLPYYKTTFHNIFFAMLTKEIKQYKAIIEFERRASLETPEDIEFRKNWLDEKINSILRSLGNEDKKLVRMRFFENRSYDYIADKLQILKKSCIQKVFRIKKNIIENLK